jgi:hypothetical protein
MVIEQIEAWWRENRSKSAWEARMARLPLLPLDERLAEIKRLEQIEPKATNYGAVIKSWPVRHNEAGWSLWAQALIERGEFSTGVELQNEWKRGWYLNTDLLLRFGSAEEVGSLRNASRKRLLQDPAQKIPIYQNALMQDLSRYWLANVVPTNRLLARCWWTSWITRRKNLTALLSASSGPSARPTLACTH